MAAVAGAIGINQVSAARNSPATDSTASRVQQAVANLSSSQRTPEELIVDLRVQLAQANATIDQLRNQLLQATKSDPAP